MRRVSSSIRAFIHMANLRFTVRSEFTHQSNIIHYLSLFIYKFTYVTSSLIARDIVQPYMIDRKQNLGYSHHTTVRIKLWYNLSGLFSSCIRHGDTGLTSPRWCIGNTMVFILLDVSYWRHVTSGHMHKSVLIQIMTCRLFRATPSQELMVTSCRFHYGNQTLNFESR